MPPRYRVKTSSSVLTATREEAPAASKSQCSFEYRESTLPLAKSNNTVFGFALLIRSRGYSMLGFGDIIIPALLVSFCLRFDYALALRNPARWAQQCFLTRYSYFFGVLFAYVAGETLLYCILHTIIDIIHRSCHYVHRAICHEVTSAGTLVSVTLVSTRPSCDLSH